MRRLLTRRRALLAGRLGSRFRAGPGLRRALFLLPLF